jgi:peptide/nickel transport system permease protein
MVIAIVIGTVLGVLAGMKGGVVDLVITFVTDARFSIPTTIIGIICACFFSTGVKTMILLIGFTGWAEYTRLIRGQVLQVKESQFVECSRAMGASTFRIVWEHILPNVTSLLIVRATMSLSSYILLESSLSYLGLGIQPPQTSLGIMLSEGRDYLTNQWWMAACPCVVIVLIILQIALIGDWLRDYLDPKLKNRV